jgi:MFS transporter, DHA1 family, multidrug resistance protein
MENQTNWRMLMVLFTLTGIIESLAYGHFGAFTPLFLRELGVAPADVPFWTGMLGGTGFIIGIPLLPFWGVWAERYGRKLLIVRSSYISALLFAIAAMSQNVWMLLFARFLVGFVLGNTGLMLAMQAETTPRQRLGSVVGIVSAGPPLGVALGPFFGALIVERSSIRTLLLIDAVMTLAVALALTLLIREPRRSHTHTTPVRTMIRQSYFAITRSPVIVRLFGAYFLVGLGTTLAQPYVPLMIDRLYDGPSLARVIGVVLTVAGIAQAIATPTWGVVGDRIGHGRVLLGCTAMVGVALAGQALAGNLATFAGWRIGFGVVQGAVGALTMALIAVRVADEHRTSVLTLSMLPMQFSWFLGPVLGATLSGFGVPFLFGVAAVLVLAALVPTAVLEREQRSSEEPENVGA